LRRADLGNEDEAVAIRGRVAHRTLDAFGDVG
jgi:hypothetical protein